jgi:hypothetical protein
MRHILTIFIAFVILTSCNNREEKLHMQIHFTTRQFQLKADTTITSIAYFKGNIICLQNNEKIIILDTNYNRQTLLESNFANYKLNYLFAFHDTVFLGAKDKLFFIDKDFRLQEFKRKETVHRRYLYEDDSYYVYGCCVGEFGGSVFFLNKKTNRTYSYFATCATQVLRFKNQYVVCNNLAHLGSSMSFLFIPDPVKLYELTDERSKNHCNWYVEVDSLKNYWEQSPIGGVNFHRGAYGSMSLASFSVNDSLYSILTNDSATYIAVHKGDTTFERQRILNKAIQFHQTQVIKAGNKQICLYNLTQGSPFAAYFTTGNNSGLLVIDQNKIDILDKFQTTK